jgi:hypothetical protein
MVLDVHHELAVSCTQLNANKVNYGNRKVHIPALSSFTSWSDFFVENKNSLTVEEEVPSPLSCAVRSFKLVNHGISETKSFPGDLMHLYIFGVTSRFSFPCDAVA